jgi:WD40 repeat protein/transcriptional regulator with XRE-family HTH domain
MIMRITQPDEDMPDPRDIESREEFTHGLRCLRAKAGLSVREVSKATGIGVGTLSGYYSGKHLPQVNPPHVLTAILNACGVTDPELLKQWREAQLRVRRHPSRPSTDAPPPYRGLERYEPEHEQWFYGRKDLIDSTIRELLDRRERGGPLFVVGASGSGKSSLLRAGVVPAVLRGALGGGSWRCLLMTPGAAPMSELAQQFADIVEITVDELDDMLRDQPEAARAAVAGHQDGLLVVVDQFEELFTMCADADQQKEFVHALAALAEVGDGQVLVVIAIRADFYPQVLDEPELKALRGGQVLVDTMAEADLRLAITGPAEHADLTIEPGLVELLVRDLGTAGLNVGALPLLSHALLVTWEGRKRAMLTVQAYQNSGGIGGAISASAEKVYASLDDSGEKLAHRLFLRLVRSDEHTAFTRRRVPLDELRIGDGIDVVVQKFVAHRLLTSGADGLEITHEALIHKWPRLNEWLEADLSGLRIRHALTTAANNWHESGRDPELLHRGRLLDDARDWASDAGHSQELNDRERDFLDASRRVSRSRKRRRYTVAAIVAVLALVASLLSGYVVAQSQAVAREHDTNDSIQLAEQAARFRTSDISLSMQFALAAYRISPTPQARASLLDSVAGPVATRMVGSGKLLQAVAATLNGRLVATGGADNQVHLWDLGNRSRPVQAGPALTGATDTLYSVAFSANGKVLAAAGADRTIRLWDVTAPAHARQLGTPLTGPTNTVYTVSFSPDGKVLAAGSADNVVRLWDVADPSQPLPLGTLTGFSGYVQAVAFSRDGRFLAAASADQTVWLWNVTDPAHPAAAAPPLTGAAGKLLAVAFSPDGTRLAAGGADRLVHLWDVTDPAHPAPVGEPLAGATGWINGIAFSADGTTVAVASSDNTVKQWDIASAQQIEALAHPGPVTSLAFLPDGDLVTSDADGTTRLWRLPGRIDDRADTVFSLSYPAAGNLLAVSSGNRKNSVQLWDTSRFGRPMPASPPIAGPSGSSRFAGSLGLSPDGRTLATGSQDGMYELWDVTTPQHPAPLGNPVAAGDQLLESLQFSNNGKLLVSAGDDHLARIWDVHDRTHPRLLTTLSGPTNYVYGVAFSSDDRLLAAPSADGRAWLWDVSKPSEPVRLPPLTGFDGYVYAVAFSPHSPLIVVGSADKTVRMWDLSDPRHPIAVGGTLTAATNYVYAVAFSPDGHTLAAGSTDNSVEMWDVSQPAHPSLLASLTAAADSVFVVAFSPDGRTLAAGTAEKAVRLWPVDPTIAASEVCATAGAPVTQQEWTRYLPDHPYQPPC